MAELGQLQHLAQWRAAGKRSIHTHSVKWRIAMPTTLSLTPRRKAPPEPPRRLLTLTTDLPRGLPPRAARAGVICVDEGGTRFCKMPDASSSSVFHQTSLLHQTAAEGTAKTQVSAARQDLVDDRRSLPPLRRTGGAGRGGT